MSAISSLAEKGDRIKRTFIVHDFNKDGIYGVRVCENGEWRDIMVDDYFPTSKVAKTSKIMPAFTRANGPEMWVLLLEKVWAKVNSGYDRIIGGFATEVLHDFTGAPTLMMYTAPKNVKAEKLWSMLLVAT